MKITKSLFLKLLLVIGGAVQIIYWGISHILFPEWYLQSVGLVELSRNPGSATVFLNEIGVLTIGSGVASILAALNPGANIFIIIMLYINGIGSIIVSLYNIIIGKMTSGEWTTIIIISIQMLLLTILYPWKELNRNYIRTQK